MTVAPALAGTNLAATPITRIDLPWWKHRYEEKQRALHSEPVELVFYGDSITQDWERPDFAASWQHFYGNRHAVNLGFVGDTTANLLWRIEHGEADGIAPKAAVILIGANNFGRVHWPAAETVAGIEKIVSELRRRLPHTRLLLLSVLPSDRGQWVAENTLATNRALAARFGDARVEGVQFLDVTTLFMRDGKIDRGAYRDPSQSPPQPALHPAPAAQARLAAAIEPTLSRMLGDPAHAP